MIIRVSEFEANLRKLFKEYTTLRSLIKEVYIGAISDDASLDYLFLEILILPLDRRVGTGNYGNIIKADVKVHILASTMTNLNNIARRLIEIDTTNSTISKTTDSFVSNFQNIFFNSLAPVSYDADLSAFSRIAEFTITAK